MDLTKENKILIEETRLLSSIVYILQADHYFTHGKYESFSFVNSLMRKLLKKDFYTKNSQDLLDDNIHQDILAFMCFLTKYNIKNIHLGIQSNHEVYLKLEGFTPVNEGYKEIVFFALKGTDLSDNYNRKGIFHQFRYIQKFFNLLSKKIDLNLQKELDSIKPNVKIVLCGHSYGAWLCKLIQEENRDKNIETYLFSCPEKLTDANKSIQNMLAIEKKHNCFHVYPMFDLVYDCASQIFENKNNLYLLINISLVFLKFFGKFIF